VDGTLTRDTSLFGFLAYDLAARGRPAEEYDRARARLRALTAGGAPRTQTNRAYFGLFAGRDAARLAARGREWFRQAREQDGFYREEGLAAFREHAARGDLTVLVSGSFPPCLDPIKEELGADVLLCTRPEIRDGRYTGRVAAPMVDDEKGRAVRALAAERGLRLSDSRGYADHGSDLPFLEAVGRPVVVGCDPAMRAIADQRGWPVLEPSLPDRVR